MPSMFTGSNWYKGALHCHSSVSDGRVPPRELIRAYRERGYSFAALTDHDFFGHYPGEDSREFLSIPGAELIFNVEDFSDNIRGTHIVALAQEPGGEFGTPGTEIDYHKRVGSGGLNAYLNRRKAGGNSLILAHPYWSYMDLADAARVEGCFAMELFNGVCHLVGLGESLAYWDYLLRRGIRILGVATDDHHGLGGDLAAGWVCVKAGALARASIFEALHAGSYYSSTGPEILDFGIRGGKAFLSCKPVRAIKFIAYGENCWPDPVKPGDGGAEYGEYALTGRESYVRAEVEGFDGRRAWTNPIFF